MGFFLFWSFRADCSLSLFLSLYLFFFFVNPGFMLQMTNSVAPVSFLCHLRFTENNNSCHLLEQSQFRQSKLTSRDSGCPWLRPERDAVMLWLSMLGWRKWATRNTNLLYKWMSRYYDIKQSLSYHFVLPTPNIKGVLSAALTTAVLFSQDVSIVQYFFFHSACPLMAPPPSSSIYSLWAPLVLSILIISRWHLNKG